MRAPILLAVREGCWGARDVGAVSKVTKNNRTIILLLAHAIAILLPIIILFVTQQRVSELLRICLGADSLYSSC